MAEDGFEEQAYRSVAHGLYEQDETETRQTHHKGWHEDPQSNRQGGLQKEWSSTSYDGGLSRPVFGLSKDIQLELGSGLEDSFDKMEFGQRPKTLSFEEDFGIEHAFPSFDKIGGSIDVSQSTLFPQLHDDPDSPPMIPSFFIRPSCYVCQLDGKTTMSEIEKVLRKKHFDVRKPDEWVLACMAYKEMDEISFAVQVYSSDLFPGKCLVEINKRRGDSIRFSHLLCEIVHSFPSSFALEPYAEDVAMPMAPDDLPQMRHVEEFDQPIIYTEDAMQRVGALCGGRYLETQREGLLMLARATSNEENQRLLAQQPNMLRSLREFLDKNNHDSIQRLSLAVWKNMFKISEHREFAADDPTFVETIQALLEDSESNEVKFLVLCCLESLAHSHPSLVYKSGVELYEKHSMCEDDRIQSLCQTIIDLQLVA